MKSAALWKRILNEGIATSGSNPEKKAASLLNRIMAAKLIVDSRPREGAFSWTDIPAVAVPFDWTWVEGVHAENETHLHGGLICECSDEMVNGHFPGPVKSELAHLGECRKYLISVVAASATQPPTHLGNLVFGLDERGVVVRNRFTTSYQGFDADRITPILDAIAWASIDTLGLMSCRNVGLVARDNEPKQVRRAEKRHGSNPDGYRYHVLVVRPPGAKSTSPGVEIGTMPRHVCRGHFAEYGPEFNKGLLFGKYAGRFFVPPHLKGKKENGIVEKDYEIRVGGSA